jgi:predicted RNA polymerase sigma factor
MATSLDGFERIGTVDRNYKRHCTLPELSYRIFRAVFAAALAKAEALARPLAVYTLQAAIAACHARAPSVEATDWPRIVALYDALLQVTGSPIVALNRAVAVGMTDELTTALALVDELRDEASLSDFHLVPAVRGDLLLKLGRRAEAKRELARAAALATNSREQALLLRRAGDAFGLRR